MSLGEKRIKYTCHDNKTGALSEISKTTLISGQEQRWARAYPVGVAIINQTLHGPTETF